MNANEKLKLALDAFNEVLRISDRKHDAWDNARAAIAALSAPTQDQPEPDWRLVVGRVCEGYTLPDAVRKQLETLLYAAPQAAQPATSTNSVPVQTENLIAPDVSIKAPEIDVSEREAFEAWWEREGKYKSGPKENCFRSWQARAQAGQIERQAVPGWKLVPIEPTQEMCEAGQNSGKNAPFSYTNCYCTMIAAAPMPPCRLCNGSGQTSPTRNCICTYGAAPTESAK